MRNNIHINRSAKGTDKLGILFLCLIIEDVRDIFFMHLTDLDMYIETNTHAHTHMYIIIHK